jgi:hypothetical protein
MDKQGQFSKKRMFFVRLNNATRAIEDEDERQRYIAHRWGGGMTEIPEVGWLERSVDERWEELLAVKEESHREARAAETFLGGRGEVVR